MSTGKHYLVEHDTEDGTYTTTAKGADRASGRFRKQSEAIDKAIELNPDDHPDVERVRDTGHGKPGQWRSATRKSK
jgi:hypothetical protein